MWKLNKQNHQNQGHNRHSMSTSSLESTHSQQYVQWQGTCIHNFETPRWVQKRRRLDPEDAQIAGPVYDEPRRAVAIAINGKFSLVAVGTHRLVGLMKLNITSNNVCLVGQ